MNSIRQDPVNRNLLYAPTEFGFYISLNDGGEWHPFMPNLPHVRIDEVLVHPRDRDLILATHARGIWIMDDISALQSLDGGANGEGRGALQAARCGAVAARLQEQHRSAGRQVVGRRNRAARQRRSRTT